MRAGAAEVRPRSASRLDPAVALRRQVSGYGSLEGRLLVAIAVLGPVLFLGLGLVLGLHGAATALLVLVPTQALGVGLGIRSRHRWPALDVIAWQRWQIASTWQREVGGSLPRNAAGAGAWLETHPEGSVPTWARATMLLLASRVSLAQETIAAMPESTPKECRLRLDLQLAADAAAGLPLDAAAADAAIREDRDQAPTEVAVHLAYHQAMVEVARDGDGLPALLAVRPLLDPLPADLVRRLWVARFQYGATSLLVGVWLLAMVLVGLATSGGVVWF